MKRSIIIGWVGLLLLSACDQPASKTTAEDKKDGDNIVINLDKRQGSAIPLSTYFKSVQTIILETTDESLIGSINELQVFDGFIYILDRSITKSLFVFDQGGRFVRKIGRSGNGPGEHIQLSDFTLDTENGFIFVLDYGKYIHKYRLDGTFIQTIRPELPRESILFLQYYKNKLYLSVNAFEPAPDDNMLWVIDPDDGTILDRTLPLKYNKDFGRLVSHGHSFFLTRTNDPPRYARTYMDNIVAIGEEIAPYIELKSKDLTTPKDLEALQPGAPGYEMAVMQFSKIRDVNSFLENDDFILFRYWHGSMFKTVIYNKKTGAADLTDYLKNDLIFKDNDKDGASRSFAFSDSKGAYEILYGLFGEQIENLQESIRNNEVNAGLDKLDQLSKLEKDANPAIFYYEYK